MEVNDLINRSFYYSYLYFLFLGSSTVRQSHKSYDQRDLFAEDATHRDWIKYECNDVLIFCKNIYGD